MDTYGSIVNFYFSRATGLYLYGDALARLENGRCESTGLKLPLKCRVNGGLRRRGGLLSIWLAISG